MRRTSCVAILACMAITVAFAQEDKPNTSSRSQREVIAKAAHLMDSGEFDKARLLLFDILKTDPDNATCAYEIAYSYSMERDYRAALRYAEPLLTNTHRTDQHFEMVGNCYDYLGEPQKAIEVYRKGFETFPTSGRLCLELGVMFAKQEKYDTAMAYFEKGIVVEPMFPSNYYWASRFYLNSTEGVWGMIYGEIFMNLERNTRRTVEMSELLYKSYKERIKITSDKSATVSFSRAMVLPPSNDRDTSKFRLPYGIGVYEPVLSMSLGSLQPITLNRLDTIRTTFLESYKLMGFDSTYPNVLFNFQDQVRAAGHLEAYNHWLLMKGDEEAFGTWLESNKQKLEDFYAWFKVHRIAIDKQNTFCSSCY